MIPLIYNNCIFLKGLKYDLEDEGKKQAGALEINLLYVIVFLLVLRALEER
jgi:hypothetical protein